MARITIEDCSEMVPDRFKLVALAAQRAKDINSGSEVAISNNKRDKPTVVALREIALGHVIISSLTTELLNRLRTNSRVDPIDDESVDPSTDENAESFDYLPSGSDIYITEDYSDLDDQIFNDNVIEED